MTKIITTKNHIVFDGHADSVQECETITLLANALAESEKFKTIKYESGYAEFEKVGKAKELKFAPAEITVIFDSHITKVVYHGSSDVEFSTSGEQKMTSALDGTEYLFTVTLETGYILDTVTLSNADPNMGTLVDKTDTTFTILASVGGISQTITLTSKQSTPTYPKINSFTYFGKQINNINGKPIRYVHHSGNTYEMVYLDPNANYLTDANGYVLQDSDGNYLEFTEELATPQNVTANGTTVSWDEVENATSYDIYADGVSIGTVENTGTDPLAGTWVFNDTLTGAIARYYVNFNSNGENFDKIEFPGGPMSDLIYGDSTMPYNRRLGWVGAENYKTITITSKLSEVTDGDTLLAWLQTNATKQSTTPTPTLISFTIEGTTYQAEEGMTWEQWVASSYNTGGFYISTGKVTSADGYFVATGKATSYIDESPSNIIESKPYILRAGGGGGR